MAEPAEPDPRPDALLRHFGAGAADELVRSFWTSPVPVTLQDASHRLVAVNDAFVAFVGRPRADLIGCDPATLMPDEDAALHRAAREQPDGERLTERRVVDGQGHERWFRATRSALDDGQGRRLVVAVLQDTTAEHHAREQVDRSLRELEQWFDLSPVGMLMFDRLGLIVRSNAAFEALVGRVPVALPDGDAPLRELLGWERAGAHPALVPQAPPLERTVALAGSDGRLRQLRARVRAIEAASGQRRFLAVVEDRSVEDERDLAQIQIGALMDTAGVGVATFEPSRGWRQSAPSGAAAAGVSPKSLQAISRELVEPASLPEYERLQRALKGGERAEVRYAVRHPELGQRWLLTRVEPGQLGSGSRTTSVVTLDVTEQEQAQRRNEQLLRELSTLLHGTSAGIVFLRQDRIERANEAFAELTGYAMSELATLDPAELYEDRAAWLAWQANEAPRLRRDGRWSGERRLRRRDGRPLWVHESLRLVDEADPDAGLICSYVNVDERQRARESLLLQADRTRSILDSVLVGIVTVGAGGIEWMNRSARRMFGGELADFVGEPIATVATPDADHPLRRTHYLTRLDDGQAEAFECRLMARDGREFWVVGNVVATGREAAGGRQLTFALLDIERRRQAELRIAQTQASLQRIIETAPLAIGLFDARTLTLLQLNQMAAMFIGRPLAQVLGQPVAALFEPAVGSALQHDMHEALATQDVVRRELRRELDGELRVWDTRYVSLASAPGSAPEQLLLVASDVTEQRAADEARLQAAIAQRDMLVKEVHHRIKNNLQGVAGLMQQIAQRRPEVAGVISEAIGQVQAIAQVYGLQVGAAGPLHLHGVLQAIGASVSRMFGRPVTVTLAGAAPEGWLLPEAEAIPIALTVNELLTNAIKHSSEGEVQLTLEDGGDEARVVVANRGRLPAGFDLARVPAGVSGLGLVRALLPRRHARLAIAQDGARVAARVVLSPPGVTRG